MVNLLPAVVIGGPPHAGKSVLFYSLTKALRERGIAHHAIRACPDGEGNWSQESDQETVRLIRVKGDWSDEFTERICLDIERRLLPMLIDVGGKPQGKQLRIFRHCTHSILLLHSHDEQNQLFWRGLVEENGLLPLAQLYSDLKGTSAITSESPVIKGTLVGLERHTLAQGPLFDVLVERVASLFSSYSHEELEKTLLDEAPTELVIQLPLLLETLSPGSKRWEPGMLPALLASLPADTPLSVYGQGPHYIYGALAAFVGQQAFYQFDPRLGEPGMGWVQPPRLQISTRTSPEVSVKSQTYEQASVLTVEISKKHLDYLQAEMLPFPPVPIEKGLILDGSMPSWLLTALVRLYSLSGIPWIACNYPPLKSAVVVMSRVPSHSIGDLIPTFWT
jgi:CRISPR-associated protein Csx3